MKIKILLFGSLAEYAGTHTLDTEGIEDLDNLQKWLEDQYPAFKEFSYLVAVNQEIEKDNVTLKDGDEIALMPPFAGG